MRLTDFVRQGAAAGMWICCTICCQAAEKQRVFGRVLDPHELPVSGVNVTAADSAGRTLCSTQTDSDGAWSCDPEWSGALRITVSGDGWQTAIVYPGKPGTSADVKLRPAVLAQIVVVSASRLEELQDESAQRVEAVTRKQILNTGYERASDVLSEIPGVVTRRGSSSAVAGEQVQGIDSRQVAVLQDGLPIPGARGIKSGVLNLNRQSVSNLERIEVAKGAGSALYGTDAIGGVINLISREPSVPFNTGLSVSGGSRGMLDATGSLGGKADRFSWILGGGDHRMDGYTPGSANNTSVGPEWHRYDGNGRIRWFALPQLSVTLAVTGYHNREEGINLTESGTARGLLNDSTQSFTAALDYLPAPDWTAQVRAYRTRYDENSLTTLVQGSNTVPSPANLNQVYQRLDTTVGYNRAGHSVQSGVEWAQDSYRGVNRLLGDNAGQQITMTDGWVQDRWAIGRRITLTAGGRVNAHSTYGVHVVPKAGLVVRATEHLLLRGSYGHGFRAPDPGQLYYRFANPASFYQVLGNPTLRPENSQSIQAGAGWRSRRWRSNLTLFHNRVRDLIDSVSIGTPRSPAESAALLSRYGVPLVYNPILNRPIFLYQNLSRAITRGVELDAQYALTSNWRLTGAYTFLDAKDAVTGLRLAQRHRHQGFAATEYSIPRWGVSANLRGSLYSSWLLNPAAGTRAYGYRIWDVYCSKRVRVGLTAFASVDNLFDSIDRKLSEGSGSFDRPDPGRGFRVGMRWIFAGE